MEKISLEKIALEMADLRLAAQKSTGTKVTTALRSEMRKQYKKVVAKAAAEKNLFFLQEKDHVIAGLLQTKENSDVFGLPVQILIPDLKLRNKNTARWLMKELSQRKKTFNSQTMIFLPAAYRALLPKLRQIGFHTDSLLLDGDPRRSLRALVKKYHPPLSIDGIQYRKLHKKDIPQVLQLVRKEFSRNPQHGWFCTSAGFLRAMKKEILTEIKSPDHAHYVFESEGRFSGYFASSYKKGAPYAGVTFIFDKKIQGRGLLKTAYLLLLTDMVKKSVPKYRGGTSQKPVMALGKVMQRQVSFYLLRYHFGYFSPQYFRY